jgi:peptidoglycan/xylan/chitin deacetylase (PgdA/CDA1 family)
LPAQRVTILNFHGLGEPGRAIDDPDEPSVWLDTDAFEQVLDRFGSRPGVRITFDDGNKSDVEVALPELLRRRLTATFFPLAGKLGQPGYLTADDVRDLAESGMGIGTHGMDHRTWRHMDAPTLEAELVTSRTILEAAARQRVVLAACPFGSYDRGALSALRRLGYATAFTSDGGSARLGAFVQPRNTIVRDQVPEAADPSFPDPTSGLRRAVRAGKSQVKRWR